MRSLVFVALVFTLVGCAKKPKPAVKPDDVSAGQCWRSPLADWQEIRPWLEAAPPVESDVSSVTDAPLSAAADAVAAARSNDAAPSCASHGSTSSVSAQTHTLAVPRCH